MQKQIEKNVFDKSEMGMSITGANMSKYTSKSPYAMPQCVSPTQNDTMCLCTMSSVRSGLPAKGKGNKYMCDTLNMD